MDSETIHGMLRSGVTSVPEAVPSVWKTGDSGRRPLKHGSWLPVWRPVQTGSCLPDRELNAASGGDNEKTAKKTSPEQGRPKIIHDVSLALNECPVHLSCEATTG